MEKLVWGLKTIAFSQIENEKGHSHENIPAVDMQGNGTGQDEYRASCFLRVLSKSSSAHTVYFGSCDANGNKAKVLCADGRERVVTIALTHIDDYSWIKVGQIFKPWDVCYKEGSYAGGKKNSVGNHVHIEVAEGWVATKTHVKIAGKDYWRFHPSVSLNPTDVFFGLRTYNTVRVDKLISVNRDRMVTLHWTNDEEEEDMKIRMKAVKEIVVLRKTMSFNSSKKPNGEILAKMTKGEVANVKAFYPIQVDGYQWLGVEFNGQKGYMQYDSTCYELEEY